MNIDRIKTLILLVLVIIISIIFYIISRAQTSAFFYGGNQKHNRSCSCCHSNLEDAMLLSLKSFHGGNLKYKNNQIVLNKDIKVHSWYKHTWENIFGNQVLFKQYSDDRDKIQSYMNLDWTEVFKEVLPIVKNDTAEHIGIIRARDDMKTLYVYQMESSNIRTSNNQSYSRYVPIELCQKYNNIPGYFIFHTHPSKVSNPLPSDADLYISLIHARYNTFFANVVIGEYGAIIYFMPNSEVDKIWNEGGDLSYHTFCYNVIMAWNAIDSIQKRKLEDNIKVLNKFGIFMIVIPSSEYIRDSNFAWWNRNILCDRFIETKYQLLDSIKETIMEYEKKEQKNKQLKSNKKISKK